MIMIKQTNGVSYYKVVKETRCYMWIRQLDIDRVKRDGCYDYMKPIDDKFLNEEILKFKKHIDNETGKSTLWKNGFCIKEFDGISYGYHWLGA